MSVVDDCTYMLMGLTVEDTRLLSFNHNIVSLHFLTRELRACARASCRYDVENGTRSLARSIGRFL